MPISENFGTLFKVLSAAVMLSAKAKGLQLKLKSFKVQTFKKI